MPPLSRSPGRSNNTKMIQANKIHSYYTPVFCLAVEMYALVDDIAPAHLSSITHDLIICRSRGNKHVYNQIFTDSTESLRVMTDCVWNSSHVIDSFASKPAPRCQAAAKSRNSNLSQTKSLYKGVPFGMPSYPNKVLVLHSSTCQRPNMSGRA